MATSELAGKVILITGATQGIGKASAVALAQKGATIVMVGRDPARSQAAVADVKAASGNDKVELLLADLSSQAQVRKLAADFKARHQRLDVLLNNAGAMHQRRKVTADGLEETFAVNHVAYFLLTDLLLPVLKASAPARIVNVASDAHRGARLDLDDLQSAKRFSPFLVYCNSKLANVLFTYELARRLQGTGVTANCLHPGVIASGFGRNDGGLFSVLVKLGAPLLSSPEKGARTSVHLASAPEVAAVTGQYFKSSRAIRSSAASYDVATQQRLWSETERLLATAGTAAA